MKSLVVLLLVAGSSSLALAQSSYQYSSPQTRGSVRQITAPSENAVTFGAEADLGAFTITNNNNGNLGDGQRTNVVELTPKLLAYLPLGITGHISAPFFWATDQSNTETRFIGRPELGAWRTYTNNMLKLNYGLDLRTPIADSSVGNTEQYRIWGVYPGYNGKWSLTNSSFHVIQNGTVSYNSTSSGGYSFNGPGYNDTSVYTQSNPIVVFLGAGGGMDISSKASIDMSVNFVNGIGMGHYTNNFSSTGQATQVDTGDIAGADLSYLKLAGSFEIAQGTKLTSYISKSLKDVANHGSGGVQLDDYQAISTLGVGAGISKTF
jgi:hypothetical protein